MIIAVLDKRAGAPIGNQDTYVSSIGGVRITEPSSDLAVAVAIASAVLDEPIAHDLLALGEVGLSGEVRPAVGVGRRLAEAARLGFRTALVPKGALDDSSAPPGMDVVEVVDVASAIAQAGRGELDVDVEAAGAQGLDELVVAEHDERARVAAEDALQPVAQDGPGRHLGKG